MSEKKIADAPAAETVVRRALETQYGDKLKSLSFHKCWYSSSGKQEFWDVEGTLTRKKGYSVRRRETFDTKSTQTRVI